jgi:hypothetical protein
MTNSKGDHQGEKFIGFSRLVDACDQRGCPVCRCLTADARQYLEALIYEHVNDPDTRRRLQASWGFCNWHTWMLRETSDPAFGAAIICEDLLRVTMGRLTRGAGRSGGSSRRLGRWLGRLGRQTRRRTLGELYGRRPPCPACRETAAAEQRYLLTALRFIDDPQFDAAYARSAGLCVPHLLGALALGNGTAQVEQIVARTLPKWAELRRDLADFVRKHEHRNRAPFIEAEASAYLRAFEVLVGAPGCGQATGSASTRAGRGRS